MNASPFGATRPPVMPLASLASVASLASLARLCFGCCAGALWPSRLAMLLAALWVAVPASVAAAEAPPRPEGYPGSERVTLVVPFAAGGTTDLVARLLADNLAKRWGATVIVENRPGAGANIGTEFVANAKPDGRTLLIAATSFSAAPALSKSLRYDIVRDFAPVTLIATTPLVLMVSNKSGIQSVPELVARLKAKPDALNYGSSGVGTSINLSTLMFLNRVGGQALHIQYKGSAPALLALGSGEIDILFDNYATAMPLVRDNRARALALSSASRGNLGSNLPTLAESGLPGFESLTWIGMLAPAGTPAPVVAWLQSEAAAVMGAQANVARLGELGFSPRLNAPAEFAAFIRQEMLKVQQLVKDNNIQPE
jgi:tripartite-type tricarboxylate transporter receptor subunit TctC